jgi:hypothetical protein
MFSIFRDLVDYGMGSVPFSLVALTCFAFQLWMLVDAVRREDWIWAACIFFFTVLSAILYFVMVYRVHGPAAGGGMLRGFELPGAADRRRIKQLQARIHHLDKARDHLDLADIYFSRGRLAKAEAEYRMALERDGTDLDAASHLGQCLLRQGRAAEALPLLSKVVAEDPRHDFSYTVMALAEAQTQAGDVEAAAANWRRVLELNSYPRARVQYAELLERRGDRQEARRLVDEVLADSSHGPEFQKSRDKVWIARARKLRPKLR